MQQHGSTTHTGQDEAYRALGILVGLLLLLALLLGGYLLGRSSRADGVQGGLAAQQAAVVQPSASPAPDSPPPEPVPEPPASTVPEGTTSAPTPEPQPTATPVEPYPQSAEAAAARFGGDPSEWTRAPNAPNGWVFRTNGSGDWPRFVVPEGCLINQDGPNLHPGDTVYTSGFTIWFGVSS